ncbi:hypothetical protein ACIP93_05490 [Streptomyces sp. NPDC088745]|uniref:hypothetical protein n=1 Tax=Streptomyces sp. NPDC088745 TaxID=3365884 RepID=UPI00383011FA
MKTLGVGPGNRQLRPAISPTHHNDDHHHHDCTKDGEKQPCRQEIRTAVREVLHRISQPHVFLQEVVAPLGADGSIDDLAMFARFVHVHGVSKCAGGHADELRKQAIRGGAVDGVVFGVAVKVPSTPRGL